MRVYLGIDIGGTNTKFGLVDEHGVVLCHDVFPTHEPESFDDYLLKLKKHIDNLCENLQHKNPEFKTITSIGIGAPDVDHKSGAIVNPPNLKWGSVDLLVKAKSVFSPLPVYVENDANVAAIGEKTWGIAQHMENFAVITLGTGIGTGIMVHNKIIAETEGGHIKVTMGGRECPCGKTGHFEAYASMRGIKITAKDLTGKDYSFHELLEKFQNHDPLISEVFDKTADYLARGLGAIGSLICFDAFILAGGVAIAGEPFRQMVEKKLQSYLFVNHQNKIQLLLSQLATKQGAIVGAASLAYSQTKENQL